jgi:transcriptional regulator with XRE-family HTH domain
MLDLSSPRWAPQRGAAMSDYRSQKEVGAYVRELRDGAGMTQNELGQVIGLDQPSVARLEKGERAISALQLVQLAERFGVDENTILEREESLALLRAGDADSDAIKRSLDEFRSCIEDFFGVDALVA